MRGRRTLFARVANARLNIINSANARLWMLISGKTAENTNFRRFEELKLIRSENPTFVLSWTILHVIDETSPLHGLTADDLKASDAFFVLTVTGQDETSAQTMQARETYQSNELFWDHRYADVLSVLEDGTTVLDYNRFPRHRADRGRLWKTWSSDGHPSARLGQHGPFAWGSIRRGRRSAGVG